MANELRHEPTAAGTSCAQTDWEDVDTHRFQGQAAGDIAYASTNVQIRRLAIGSTGQVLEVAGGVPTWAAKGFSSRCRVYRNAAVQVMPTGEHPVYFDAEDYDSDNEFDSSAKSAAADATEAFKLHDADGGFAAGDVGKWVWNTTDNTYAKVTVFVDAGELTLDTDIMVNGENYTLYAAAFTITTAGFYLINASVAIAVPTADSRIGSNIWKNGSSVVWGSFHPSYIGFSVVRVTDILELAAADYIQIGFYHEQANMSVGNNQEGTFLSIHRLS